MKKAVLILLMLILACGLIYVLLPFHIFPLEKMLIPKDKQLIARDFNQKLPGYTKVKILKASGSGVGMSDPRLISVSVSFDIGEEPATCEGVAFYGRGDPSLYYFIWQSLECEGLNILVGLAREAITTTYDPQEIWYPPFFSCFKHEVASVLYYWVKSGKITIDEIGWPEIKTLTQEMLLGEMVNSKRVVLFDTTKREKEIIDLAPQELTNPKVSAYYLRCEGTIMEYRAKTNMDILNYRQGKDNNDWELGLPLTEIEDPWKEK